MSDTINWNPPTHGEIHITSDWEVRYIPEDAQAFTFSRGAVEELIQAFLANQRVRNMHRETALGECAEDWCEYPCPTIKALQQ